MATTPHSPSSFALASTIAALPAVPGAGVTSELRQDEIDSLARVAIGPAPAPRLEPFRLPDLAIHSSHSTAAATTGTEVEVCIEFGRTHIHPKQAERLRKGTIVPLGKHAGECVDVTVDGRVVARGEIVVLDERLCVRILELLESTRNL